MRRQNIEYGMGFGEICTNGKKKDARKSDIITETGKEMMRFIKITGQRMQKDRI